MMENNNIVFILTKSKPFGKEEYVDVFGSQKILEKYLRSVVSQYIKKDEEGCYHYVDEDKNTILYFSHKSIVKN